ncbi:hypothetical protein [Candidatus Clostridium helianthi]|uniref:Uncharacterized protein n=1 Tax=Candidatus Clostridium helianthi TaxID=3381660 RepID=A0ABW8S404_9CLOT
MENNNLPINRHIAKNAQVHDDKDNNKKEVTINDFAAAFPEWDLTPPAVVVKRVRRGI